MDTYVYQWGFSSEIGIAKLTHIVTYSVYIKNPMLLKS